ncbi:uncharacterized protein LOC106667957 isoform X4 [Cimex lectularius]|uniref:Uncharacterized protein n=1 Tax=Cimex lectularius TaxID=79782 RepID=A0A8I6RSP5_CIMLE|nr:uncharacterized protein LOC106667957 isoform X4 [Cimex lectularius]
MPNIFKWRTLVIIENKCVLCIKDFYFSNFILADKMNCIRVRTCCFMCSVTTGSKIFGWVITLASTAGIIYLAATFNDVFTPPVSIAGLTFAGLVLFGGVTLLVGIYSESSNAVLGALIVLVLVFLGAVALAVPFAEGYITGKVSFMKTLPSFAGIILLILYYLYQMIVINSARREVKRNRELKTMMHDEIERKRDLMLSRRRKTRPLRKMKKQDEEEDGELTAMEYLKYRRKELYPLPNVYRNQAMRIRQLHRRRGWSPIHESRYNPYRRLTPVVVPNLNVPEDNGIPGLFMRDYDALPDFYSQDLNIRMDQYPPPTNYPKLSRRFARPFTEGATFYRP